MTRARLLRLPTLAALPLLLLWPALRHSVESRMSLHMLVEFPALCAAGWAACTLAAHWPLTRPLQHAAALLDWHGWTTATLVSGVAAVWMLPSALDATLMSGSAAAAKLASWWLAGVCLAGGWRRMPAEVLLFFAGNLAWMFATAGMLYLDTPARLCVNYLQDDQRHTGIGLVLLALALGALALRQALRTGAPAATEPRPVA
ncbi:MAG: hypothetical protein KF891_24140 [Rhizobacter sp.]|nr:hypothetical protein [Rhizobacter sp.]